MFLSLPNLVNANTHTRQTSTMATVFTFLHAAKVAQENDQPEKAHYFWLRAKSLHPSLRKPSWLVKGETPITSIRSVDVNERQLLLKQSSQTLLISDTLMKSKLEGLLKVNPMDKDIRYALLHIAKRQGDQASVQRHKSILEPLPKSTSSTGLKLALLVLISVAILLCIFTPLSNGKSFYLGRCIAKLMKIIRMLQSFRNKK